jgi:hypothetical protein
MKSRGQENRSHVAKQRAGARGIGKSACSLFAIRNLKTTATRSLMPFVYPSRVTRPEYEDPMMRAGHLGIENYSDRANATKVSPGDRAPAPITTASSRHIARLSCQFTIRTVSQTQFSEISSNAVKKSQGDR